MYFKDEFRLGKLLIIYAWGVRDRGYLSVYCLSPESIVDIVDQVSSGPRLPPGDGGPHVVTIPLVTSVTCVTSVTELLVMVRLCHAEDGVVPVHGVHQVARHSASEFLLDPELLGL